LGHPNRDGDIKKVTDMDMRAFSDVTAFMIDY